MDVSNIDVRERASALQGIRKGVHRLTDTGVGKQAHHAVERLIKDRLYLITFQLAVVAPVIAGSIEQLVTQVLVHLLIVKHHAAAQHVGNCQSHRDAVMAQDVLPSAPRREPRVAGKEKLGRELDAAGSLSIKGNCRKQVRSIEDRKSQRHTCSAITPVQFVTIFH